MHDINALINSEKYNEALNLIGGYKKDELINFLKKMILIRLSEQKLADEKKKGTIGGPVHLAAGQEAISVGVLYNYRNGDKVFGGHRSHAQVLSLGSNLESFFSEILGKKNGLSGGMGGSMHLWDSPHGFYGSVPIVSGTVPLALGAALASKMDEKNEVAFAFFGDSALEEGVVQECFNIASLMKLPIIFVVENNLYGSHMHITERQSGISGMRFAKANNINSKLLDGNNVIQIAIESNELIKRARKYNEPGFIEAITYRWFGHVDWREDIDVGVNRSQEELINWKKRDPIKRLKDTMLSNSLISENSYNDIYKFQVNAITKAWTHSLQNSYPNKKELLDNVYHEE